MQIIDLNAWQVRSDATLGLDAVDVLPLVGHAEAGVNACRAPRTGAVHDWLCDLPPEAPTKASKNADERES